MAEQPCPERNALSRNNSGPLTPNTTTSLHRGDHDSSVCRKRKRDGIENLLDDPLILKFYPSSLQTKPYTLQPVALLPRVHLPISSLDLQSTSNLGHRCRLFEGTSKILELEHRIGTEPVVLIARQDKRNYYVIELVSKGLYALCKLGSWVDIGTLCAQALVATRLPLSKKPTTNENMTSLQNPTPVTDSKQEMKRRLAIEAFQSALRRPINVTPDFPQTNADHASTSVRLSPNSSDLPSTVSIEGPKPSVPVTKPPSLSLATATLDDDNQALNSANVLENIRTQYLEALYLSKASLGYFAKGSLSKARAAFHLDVDASLDMHDLAAFLESLVLSTSMLEKKYKEALPAIVSMVDIGQSGGDAAPKKRCVRKMKLGRNGLYNEEQDLVRRWWENCEDDNRASVPGQSLAETMRVRMTQLRTRETQLQIIVILEALAISSQLRPTSAADVITLPGSKSAGHSPTRKNPRKKVDFAAIAEIHADRLCIWQSIAADVDESHANKDDADQSSSSFSAIQSNRADALREFCAEVIVPFYFSRLPKLCDILNCKLGGPSTSIARPRPPKTSSTSVKPSSRPGTIIAKNSASSGSSSLQRALKKEKERRNESRAQSSTLALLRSATLTSMPPLKRESSETPSLSSFPPVDVPKDCQLKAPSKTREHAQSNLQRAKKSDSNGKQYQQIDIETELASVISAIRKPNRQLAGQSMMEIAERRALGPVRIRKTVKPVQCSIGSGVQINATPRTQRLRDVLAETQHFSSVPAIDPNGYSIAPTAFTTQVSQCRMMPPATSPAKVIASFAAAAPIAFTSSTIAATPSRKLPTTNKHEVLLAPPSSPLKPRSYINDCPSTTSANYVDLADDENTRPVQNSFCFATPQKHAPTLEAPICCPDSTVKHIYTGNDELRSNDNDIDDEHIFRALGWEDEDELA